MAGDGVVKLGIARAGRRHGWILQRVPGHGKPALRRFRRMKGIH
jgi:hypothetical protein